MYKPIKHSLQMNTPALYYSCTTKQIHGREQKKYSEVGSLVKGLFKEKSGSEVVINGVKVITKGISFICWYDPKIKQDGKLDIYGNVYEIKNAENVELRNMFLLCTLEYIGAGA